MLEILLNKLKNNIGQLTFDEYKYIIPFLGKSNFLVFGTGNDSELWNYANKDGKTVFLENQEEWIKPEYKNVIKVDYTCKITDYKKLLDEFKKGIYDNLTISLPEEIKNIRWDVIFIDSPTGYNINCPGRMQSIYTGYSLSNKDTHVFIHDCNREVEDLYSKEMFVIIDEIKKLRYLHKKI
jgi:glucuronoxylan 4-O-methyltransferase